MHSRVVFHLARVFGDAGYATLRFNFRGVGDSAGVHDGGEGEQDDARAAFTHLEELVPGVVPAIAGYSFGAWVGLRIGGRRSEVPFLVGVGLPVEQYDFSFLADGGPDLLILQGERDPIGPLARVREVLEVHRPDAVLRPVPGGDHLFQGVLARLRGELGGYLAERGDRAV